jgi:dTDP-4-dehydrorhamnose reductase
MSPLPMRVLVTGGRGRLGQALRPRLPEAWMPPRAELDLHEAAGVAAAIDSYRPTHVLHAAAFTDVRAAEQDPEACWRTNVQGTTNLLRALEFAGLQQACTVLYVSTACVFAGTAGPYSEDDAPEPCNAYGRSKLAAENLVRAWPQHLVVRTNFVAAGPWPYPKAFSDRFGTYLYADDVAEGLAQLLREGRQGLVHLVGDRRLSMWELARLSSPQVQPMGMDELRPRLPLTMDMSLCSHRVAARRLGAAPRLSEAA